MSTSLIVGVDPGRYGHGVVARTAEDAEVVRERVDNDAAAIDELVTRVVGLVGGGGEALWVIEADGGDGAVLIGELLARGEFVATLTPTEVAVRRKGRRQIHKSDLIDAEVCAGRQRAASYNELGFKAQMVDNRSFDSGFAIPAREPPLDVGEIPRGGGCHRGWVTIEVPAGQRPGSIVLDYPGWDLARWRIP